MSDLACMLIHFLELQVLCVIHTVYECVLYTVYKTGNKNQHEKVYLVLQHPALFPLLLPHVSFALISPDSTETTAIK